MAATEVKNIDLEVLLAESERALMNCMVIEVVVGNGVLVEES